MMKPKAFSLVELLIVLGVIGVLVSMGAVSYPRAVGIARQVSCKANLRVLSVMLRAARESQRENKEWQSGQPPFVNSYKWPGAVAAEAGMIHGGEAFLCPSDERDYGGVHLRHPPLQYRTAHRHRPLLPYDPAHRQCVMRQGINEHGEPYTEYCIEDNLYVESKWEYAAGVKAFSTNDGIWRIYDRPINGRKKVVLTWFDCWWSNDLWVEGEWKTNLHHSIGGLTLYFDYAETSYGYNADLTGSFVVGDKTIVLLDYPEAYVDATQSDIYEELDSPDGARHFGQHNILYASGAVSSASTVSLYPDINMGQWTADPTD